MDGLVLPPQDPPASGAAVVELHTELFGPLTVRCAPKAVDELRRLAALAAVYSVKSLGAGTRRVYRSAWLGYEAWCRGLGMFPLAGDPHQVAMYLSSIADRLCTSTIETYLAGIICAHRLALVPLAGEDPRLRTVVEGIVNDKGREPVNVAYPVSMGDLRAMLASLPAGSVAIRNRLLLLLGWGGALRRSEIVGLRIRDIEEVPGRGLAVFVRKSKTDQEGRGHLRGIYGSTDPTVDVVSAWRTWLALRLAERIDAPAGRRRPAADEPLFIPMTRGGRLLFDWQDEHSSRRRRGQVKGLSDKAVDRLVKACAVAAGLPRAEEYSAHSLRHGLGRAARAAGARREDLMAHGNWASDAVDRYILPTAIWENNVTERLFAS